jgi:hypothetical protein
MKKYIIMLLCGLSFTFAQDYLGDEDDVRYSIFGGINMNGGIDAVDGFDVDGFNKMTIGFRYNIDEKQDVAIALSQVGGEDADGAISYEGFDLSYNYTFFDNLTLAGYAGGVYSMMTEVVDDGFYGTDQTVDIEEENGYGLQFGLKWFASESITLTGQYRMLLTEFDGMDGKGNALSLLIGYNF